MNKLKHLISESLNSKLYTIFDHQLKEKILVKEFTLISNAQQDAANLNEYNILNELDINGVRKVLKTETVNNKVYIYFEYIEGKTLKEYKAEDIVDFLETSIKIIRIINNIHRKNIIHKDLNSNNIIITSKKNVFIIDFGISTKLSVKKQFVTNPENLEGTLQYISPEQTGRMNRNVDYRSDLYSLGITFYELLCRKLPFDSNDPLELIHYHIAKNPVPPNQINKDIPKTLSDIILKLLSKNPEDRYQSSYGIKYDLEKCLEFAKNETICDGSFSIATKDFSGKLQIPQKLYGRENELEILENSFDRACSGASELAIISGNPGTGKTVLVDELFRRISQQNGYLIKGKFDQYQTKIPFSAVRQAFVDFCDIILTENKERLQYWKQLILSAVRNNGKVLFDLIPNLELIIGKQPQLTKLGVTENQNRFINVFRDFVRAICKPEHPLVLFIDDWQWSDSATLMFLITTFKSFQGKHLMLIGAYRPKEMPIGHGFIKVIENAEKDNINVCRIELSSLQKTDVQRLVKDTISSDNNDLANAVFEKTNGNPFFTATFLNSLYENSLLKFKFPKNIDDNAKWIWDVNLVAGLQMTDNVIDLLISKIEKLNVKNQNIIKIASCIDNKFDIELISEITQQSKIELKNIFLNLIEKDLVIPLDENLDKIDNKNQLNSFLKFRHDRIQQAAYSLIDNKELEGIHLQIARLYTPEGFCEKPKKAADKIFEIVSHYNKALNLIDDKNEILKLANLNIFAAQEAQLSTAYTAALQYLEVANQLLLGNQWNKNYELAYRFNKISAECNFLNSEEGKALEYLDILKKNHKTLEENIYIKELSANILMNISKGVEARNVTYNALLEYGYEIPETEKELKAKTEFIFEEIQNKLKNKNIFDLLNLPEAPDNEQTKKDIFAISLLHTFVQNDENNLTNYLSAYFVNQSLSIGKHIAVSLAYIYFAGYYVSEVKNEYQLAAEFGKIGYEISETYGINKYNVGTRNWYSQFLSHLNIHLYKDNDFLLENYRRAQTVGELLYASYVPTVILEFAFWAAPSIQNVMETHNRQIVEAKKYGFVEAKMFFSLWYHSALALLGKTKAIDDLNCETYNQGENDAKLEEIPWIAGFYYPIIFVNYAQAGNWETIIRKYEKREKFIYGISPAALHGKFFYTLALLKSENYTGKDRLKKIEERISEFCKIAKIGKENFEHKYLILKAEKLIFENKNLEKIIITFDQAIKSAKDNNYVLYEAFANELAAEYFFKKKFIRIAKAYIRQAYKLFEKYGAVAKTTILEKKYPHLESFNTSGNKKNAIINTTFNSEQNIDIQSIVKASQTLSGEIHLHSLLEKMMTVVIENAGAEKGFLLLKSKNDWRIEAGISAVSGKQSFLQSKPLFFNNKPILAISIFNYVVRTREVIIVDNALTNTKFLKDEYIADGKILSILCMPLINKNKLEGVLYLENSLNKGVFTPKRIEPLKLLTSQMAISLENVQLYENLEEKVKERSAEVLRQKEIIEAKNQSITASINYAQRIQGAMLATMENIQKHLPESFILFKPRDVVSGDFYWFTEQNGKIFIAAIDCTGHGIPGAFMSMIGNQILNEIVGTRKIYSPDEILMALSNEVRTALKQETTKNQDGMDAALCVIDKENHILEFAGAKNPLVYIQNEELNTLKGSKLTIGGTSNKYYNEKSYQKHTIDISIPTTFYIFSDGFQDQFDEESKRKFMIKKLRELLFEIHDSEMSEQKQILDDVIELWRGDTVQLDDILLIGVKVH